MLVGLVPLLWATGSGADVMKRIAAPMVGGLLTSAFLTLEIIPVIYTYWRLEQLVWQRLASTDPRRLGRLQVLAALQGGGWALAFVPWLAPIYVDLPRAVLHGATAVGLLAALGGAAAYVASRPRLAGRPVTP
jgi:Cu(I)/Ag(I) efflux system membrane protein CusA/SilA